VNVLGVFGKSYDFILLGQGGHGGSWVQGEQPDKS
jgi:hypothetical protein